MELTHVGKYLEWTTFSHPKSFLQQKIFRLKYRNSIFQIKKIGGGQEFVFNGFFFENLEMFLLQWSIGKTPVISLSVLVICISNNK